MLQTPTQTTSSATTTCSKIRALFDNGKTVSEIHKTLKDEYFKTNNRELRYQHVRNEVLRYEDEMSKWLVENESKIK